MNVLFNTFQTDQNMEVSGKWIYPAGEPTESNPNPPAFKIARAGGANKRYTKVQASLMKPHLALFRNSKDITPERMDLINDIARKCFFETILLDWKDVQDEKGVVVPFSKEAAESLMKQLPALYDFLMGESQNLSTFNPATVEDEAGKLTEVLVYYLDHGDKDADIVLQAYRAKQPVPERIANAPELLPWLGGEYEAFFELSTCRADGVIPWTAIHHYATVNGFADTEEELQRFTWLIRAMDKVYIEKKAASKIAASPKGPHSAKGK